MISNKVVGRKWISEETSEEEELFSHCREMEMVCYAVTKVVLDADNKWKGFLGKTTNSSLANRSYIMELLNIQVNFFDCIKSENTCFKYENPDLFSRLPRLCVRSVKVYCVLIAKVNFVIRKFVSFS